MIISIAILILLLIFGAPVPFAFFGASIYMVFTLGYDPSFLMPYGFGNMNTTVLLAIPLFIIAGGMIDTGGMGDRITNLANALVGKIKGGLSLVTIVSCALFGAISGSGAATMTTIGTIMLPRMEKAGYPKGFSASLLASSSVLGMLIPPSGLMIIFAWISNQSVLAAFLSTIIPGLILIILLSITSLFYLRKEDDIKVNKAISLKEQTKKVNKSFIRALPGVILGVIILGGIYGGIITVTEAAAASVIYSLFIGLWVYKGLNKRNILNVFIKAANMTGVIMLMLFGSSILTRMFIEEKLPDKLINLLFIISEEKIIVLLMINLILIIVGMLMDDSSGVLLSTPILLPVAISIGVDPIHFAAILAVNLGLGVVTPPAAPLLYLAGQIGNARFDTMVTPTLVMILFAWLPTLLIVTYLPELSLFLPRLILGY
ncbi:TRAP transporter large permease [Virgibacillus sp. W0181]|uniref:TRAP transporter large permease n=1 Tax=Virgibacillus sp. W0181 TaxID=3391581 RepID=UPI003F473B66